MRVNKTLHGEVTVVSLTGDLDSMTAEQVRNELSDLVARSGRVLLDLGGVAYLSSAGLRVLLLVHQQARERNMRLALADVPSDMRAVLEATGFIDAFLVTETVEAGVLALRR
ncbi:STAS domain-containing protein [Micromonospora sp. SCSIO 07396]